MIKLGGIEKVLVPIGFSSIGFLLSRWTLEQFSNTYNIYSKLVTVHCLNVHLLELIFQLPLGTSQSLTLSRQ